MAVESPYLFFKEMPIDGIVLTEVRVLPGCWKLLQITAVITGEGVVKHSQEIFPL